ncbi:MAG: hypothetical protein JNG84_03035 [Archangium sp.]|nr:hypothetical protein [Archangium sp.]
MLVCAGCPPGPLTIPPVRDAGPGLDGGELLVDGGLVRSDAGLPLEQACAVLNAKRCESLGRCGLLAADGGLSICLALQEATWCGPTTWLSRVQAPVNTLRYDGTLALACATELEARSCANVNDEPEACSRFLLPNAQLRQPCYDGYTECIEGVCRGVSCGDRRCRPRGLAGEDCRQTSDCASGLVCKPLASTPGVGVCTRPLEAGETCIGAQECASGFSCTGRCVADAPVGGSCASARCNVQTYCSPSPDAGLVCVERLSLGSSCASDTQCATTLICDAFTRRCEPQVVTQSNAACGPHQTCGLDNVCVGLSPTEAGRCLPPRSTGAACTVTDECEEHLRCTSPDAGACKGRGQQGDSCANARDCAAFFACIGGRCAARPTLGQPCSTSLRCLWGACSGADGDGGFVCAQAGGPGARCDDDTACASQRCLQGTCLAACVP